MPKTRRKLCTCDLGPDHPVNVVACDVCGAALGETCIPTNLCPCERCDRVRQGCADGTFFCSAGARGRYAMAVRPDQYPPRARA